MTTTAATTSASSSTSNDSPIQDNNNATLEPTPIGQRHNHSQQPSPTLRPPTQDQATQNQPQAQAKSQPNNLSTTPTPSASSSASASSSSASSNSSSSSSTSSSTPPSPPQPATLQHNDVAPQQQHSPQAQQQTQPQPPSQQQLLQQKQSSIKQQQSPNQNHQQQQQQAANNNEQKRPMNAFLLFCKRQRSLVREKYPNLENRGITKILGDWWSKLDKEQKSKYTDLARQHKEAFMKAHPDFKWCKTPVSNNNNSSSSTNSNSNSNDCYATNNRHSTTTTSMAIATTESSLQSQQHIPMEVVQSNSMDTLTNRQLEAPKPPKKRFLERNDSIYTKNNSTNNEPNPQGKDGIVPYISLDQDTLDRVIDEAFSEKSSNSPSGINMCKCSNRISTNLTSSMGVQNNPTSFSSSTLSYSTNVDEPVDFSMNRTINATRQQIINNLVEKMLSGPTDNTSSTSKNNCTDSVQSQLGPPVKKDSPDHT